MTDANDLPARTFRDTIRKFSPRWLATGLAEKILYAIGIQADALGDGFVISVERGYPGFEGADGEDALPAIGRARKIRRGRAEPAATYASRLITWLEDHKVRGNPYALLKQLGAYYAAAPFEISLLYESGTRFVRDIAGVITREITAWHHDSDVARWARWWLYYDWPDTLTSDGVWGDPPAWGSAGTWGSSLTPDEVTDLRLIPNEWNSEHAIGHIVLLSGGGETWGAPVGPWSDPGLWGDGTVIEIAVK